MPRTRAESESKSKAPPARAAKAAAGRRAPKEGKEGAARKPSTGRGRAIRQVLLVCGILGCAYAGAALLTYNHLDPAFSRAGGGSVTNLGGPAGAWLADVLLQTLGYGAASVVVLAVLLTRRLTGRPLGGWLATLGWLGAFGAVLTALALVIAPVPDQPFPAGGLVGLIVARGLTGAVGPVGAWLVVLGSLFAAAPFAFGVDWERVADAVWGALAGVLPAMGRAGMAVGRSAVGGVARHVRRPAALTADGMSEEVEEESEEYPSEERSEAGSVSDALECDLDEEPRAVAPKASRVAPKPPRVERVVDAPAEPSMLRRALGRLRSRPDPEPVASDDTQVALPDLVEVEWEPTVGPERVRARPEPKAKPDPREGWAGGSVVDRITGELRLNGDDPPSWPARGQLDEEVSEEISPPVPVVLRPPPPAPAADAPPRAGKVRGALAGSAANALRVMPGALESGGRGDDGALIARPGNTPYEPPHLGLLDQHERDVANVDELELHELARTLEAKLTDFGVTGNVTAIRPGPVITTFEYQPAAGIKISRISGLSDDIAMALKALRVRIVAPIPGKGVVGIEIPNKVRQTVWLRDLFAGEAFRKFKSPLPVTLGKSVEGQPRIADLASMPHLLVGGTTGSGKSVGVNAMLLSMLYTRTPEELKLILIDPKMLEFELYRDIPHLLHPVVTDPKLASAALKWACTEMDARYAILARWQTRNIEGFNLKVEQEMDDWTPAKARRYAPPDWPADEPPPPPKKLPYIVVVIDELADLMMVSAKDVEESIIRIAQKARACGIHLIVATQRPSVNVITGLIKANMPSRLAFQVRTKVDGRTILDQNGAENLLGKGDMLFLPPGVSALERLHGPFVSDEEVRRVTDFLRAQGPPHYEADIRVDDEDGEAPMNPEDYDEFYDAAIRYVAREGKASASMIQREFKIGYNRAARMIEIMEKEGVVGQADGARPREVLVGRSTA